MVLRILSIAFLLMLTAWGGAAIWFDGPESRIIASILSGSFTAASAGSLLMVRPIGRALAVSALLCLGVLAWWQSVAPSNDRDWQPAVARLARAHIDGDRITIENVRNFDYRNDSEFTEHWETRSYDLQKMVGVDMFLFYWGPRMIAHTIVSWQFADGQHLAISIETRKVKGQSYSAVRGFFRQYELVYVVAEERDIIGVRTNFRGEDVYLYRLATPPDQARAVLLDYLTTINRLVDHPTWYNALLHNCTTTIRHEVLPVDPHNPFNWRILANGYLDRLGYDRGVINTSMPFDEMRRRSNITAAAKRADQAPNFSELIREGLPSRPDWVRLSGS